MKNSPLTLDRLKPDQVALLDAAMNGDFPETWAELARSQFVTLLNEGVALERASSMAVALAKGIARDLGGVQLYIPVGLKVSVAAKGEAILREFNGSNVPQLALKYRMTERHVYRLLERDRDRRRLSSKGSGGESLHDWLGGGA